MAGWAGPGVTWTKRACLPAGKKAEPRTTRKAGIQVGRRTGGPLQTQPPPSPEAGDGQERLLPSALQLIGSPTIWLAAGTVLRLFFGFPIRDFGHGTRGPHLEHPRPRASLTLMNSWILEPSAILSRPQQGKLSSTRSDLRYKFDTPSCEPHQPHSFFLASQRPVFAATQSQALPGSLSGSGRRAESKPRVPGQPERVLAAPGSPSVVPHRRLSSEVLWVERQDLDNGKTSTSITI